MNYVFRRIGIALTIAFAVGMPISASADVGGGSYDSSASSVDPDYAAAVKAVEAKQWSKAIELLKKSVASNDKNADAHNLLGYATRKGGNVDAAFKHYERALALDPDHRGAHEYVGEAYLMVGNVAKAEEHLSRLDKLCFFGCSEYNNLKAAIAAYKEKK